MTGDYHFYGAPISYFSAKLRIYLQYKRIPYIDHLADMDAFEKVIMPGVGMPFIPVLISPNGTLLQDTTDIIDHLEAQFPQRPVKPSDPQLALIMTLVELWVDEFLLYPGLSMRWGIEEQLPWVYDEFGRVAMHHRPGPVRQVGEQQAGRITRYLPKLGFDDPAVGVACRTVFDRLLRRFDSLLTRRDFLLGNTPCLADIYLMAPIYGHWMQDPVPAALIREQYHYVAMWADRMITANAQPSGGDHQLDDAAMELLAEAGRAFGHMMLQGAQLLDEMLADMASGEDLPRGGPAMTTRIMDTPVQRRANPYWWYKYQRVWDAYAGLAQPQQSHALLEQMGCLQLTIFPAGRRVTKNKQGRLVVA